MRDDARSALVQNAADADQVKRAGRKERRTEEMRLAAYQTVLRTPEGRLVFWDLLTRAGIFQSVFHPSESVVTYNAGRQDFGHELMARLLQADEDSYQLMEREARQRAKREMIENEAAHTPSAEAPATS